MPISFFKSQHQKQVEDLLLRHADALASGQGDVTGILAEYEPGVRQDAQILLALAERLNQDMAAVTPSEAFVRRLYHDLLDGVEPEPLTLWERVRDLPPRTQIAAAAGIGGAATLTAAGVVLWAFGPKRDARTFLRNRISFWD